MPVFPPYFAFCRVGGQSNQQISVQATMEYAQAGAAAGGLAPLLRIFQVEENPAFGNTTTPQANTTASIPWSRPSNTSILGMSGFGYFLGEHLVRSQGIPIGILSACWGGTAIQPWLSPAAAAKCPGAAAPFSPHDALRAARAPGASRTDVALAAMATAQLHFAPLGGTPSATSCLYNSMLVPLLANPKKGQVNQPPTSTRLRPYTSTRSPYSSNSPSTPPPHHCRFSYTPSFPFTSSPSPFHF